MTHSAKLELSPQLSPQCDPKVTQELRVLIGDNGEWNCMESRHLSKVEIHHVRSIIGLMASYEIGHLGEAIYYHDNGVFIALRTW